MVEPGVATGPTQVVAVQSRKWGRVLIVDDADTLARAVRRGLRDTFECSVATNESEALTALGEQTWDAIVCDMMMPDLSGVQLYRWLRTARPHLLRRIVFVTGLDVRAARSSLGDIGAPVLLKPFSVDDLRATLSQLLA